MKNQKTEAEVLEKLLIWARNTPEIRAVIMTSSRARPDGRIDALSDYDIILATTAEFEVDWGQAWLYEYGEPMVRWGDEGEVLGQKTSFRSVIYRDHVKIDYTIWSQEVLQLVASAPHLPEELDAGYRILLDKEGATKEWASPTYRAFIPNPPTQTEFQALVEEFWWVATYVAKSLWRRELIFARWVLTADIREGALRKMLEWCMEIEHGWSVRPGVHGRGLEGLLPAKVSAEMLATYVDYDSEGDWTALWRTTALFSRVAKEVASALSLTYPQSIEEDVSAYLTEMKQSLRT